MESGTQKIRVGVLRGGMSPEYKVSLETGRNVLKNLSDEHYLPLDIYVDKLGHWHEAGMERGKGNILSRVDVVLNALHGSYGEDGEVAKILENFGSAYTGSKPFPSAIAANKILSKNIYKQHGLKTPYSQSLPVESISRQAIHDVYKEVPMPFMVKPSAAGSSFGIYKASSLAELEEAVLAAATFSPVVLIEEYIDGPLAVCAVVDGFRGKEHYAAIPHSDSRLKSAQMEAIEKMALLAHQVFGLRHYSSSDFIVHPKRGIFIIETDVLPPLHEESPFHHSLLSIGSSMEEFLHHIIQSALR